MNSTKHALLLPFCSSIWLIGCSPDLDVGEYAPLGLPAPGDDAGGDVLPDGGPDSYWEGIDGSADGLAESAEETETGETGPTCDPGTEPDCRCKTCTDLGASCGSPSDGCSGWLTCGACEEPEFCGGGGTPFVCACKPGTWWFDPEPHPTSTGEYRTGLTLLGDKIHVIYRVGAYPGLYYAIRSAHGPWTQSPIDSSGRALGDLALSADDAGGLHAVYVISDGSLMYAYKAPGAAWSTSSIDSVGGLYDETSVSLTVDPAGVVGVAYGVDRGPGETAIWYASRAPGQTTWDMTQLSALGAYGKTAIAADSSGGLHVTYNGNGDRLEYAHRPAGMPWTTEQLDTDHKADDDVWHHGADSSVAVDLAGGVHIIYLFATDYYAANSGVYLRYGYKAPGGLWNFTTVDGIGGGWVRIRTSLALSHSGVPHIMLSHWENATLQHIWSNGTAWLVEPIDSYDSPACETAPMAFDPTGGLHMTYSRYDGNSSFELGYGFLCP